MNESNDNGGEHSVENVDDDQQESSPHSESAEEMIESFAQNPMMERVHLALREQLRKTHDRVKREFSEQEEALRAAKKQREECGVQLYGRQQQLARLQTNLESVGDRYTAIVEKRAKDEGSIAEQRRLQEERKSELGKVKKNAEKSRTELESLYETIRHAKKYNEDMKGEVAVTRRAAHKAEETVKVMEKGKQDQDIYIDGLNEQVKRLEADVAFHGAQVQAQKRQSEEARKMILEIGAELELLAFEKKQLVQQWKSSLVALNKRDQALAAATKALKEAQVAGKDNMSENVGLRRDITQAKVHKENLALSRDRLENETKFIETAIEKVRSEQESASKHFELLQKTIASTNEEESKLKSVSAKISSEISTVNHKIEIIMKERKELEEQIGTYKHEQTTMSKAALNIAKEERVTVKEIHEREIEAANLQNELARLRIDILNTQAHSSQLEEKLTNELSELCKKDSLIEREEAEIRRQNNEIGKKMNQVDRLNRKYEKMLEGAEEAEPLGPLEATIKTLSKEIDQNENTTQQLQRDWLANQTTLVEMISETDAMQEKNVELNASLNIMKQKRLRLTQDIHVNESEIKAVEASMKSMHSDMSRLNEMIGKNTQIQTELLNENTIAEKELVHELKDLERESIQMEARIAQVKAAKGQILDEIVEAERHVLLWEKKIQLEKEMQVTLKDSENAIETQGMEKEIHRMKHRLDSLKHDQEKMIGEMERAIHKREDIAVKYSNTKDNRGGGDKPRTKGELKKMIETSKKQLKTILKEVKTIETKTKGSHQKLQEIRGAMEKARNEHEDVQRSSSKVHKEITTKLFEKQRLLAKCDRLNELIEKYEALEEGKTLPIDPQKDQLKVEKSFAMAASRIKRVQNVLSGLRLKFRKFDDVLERVGFLASDILSKQPGGSVS